MTFAELKAAAYRARPVPDGLTDTERVQYLLLRRVYAGFQTGEIHRTEAEPMVGVAEQYANLRIKEKRALLRYLGAFLEQDAAQGDPEAQRHTAFVAGQLMKADALIERKKFNKNGKEGIA